MITFLLNILSKLKLNQILIILVIVFGLVSYKLYQEVKFQKAEKVRQLDNYKNLRDLDSTKNAVLQFKTKAELQGYINSNKDLSKLLDKANIKLRKTESIVYVQQKYIDSLSRPHEVTPIIQYIKQDIDATEQWQDSSTCLIIKGNLEYKSGKLNVNVTDRIWNNKIAIIGGWERNQWSFLGIKTRLFGRRIATVKAVSNCGESKTVVLKKID